MNEFGWDYIKVTVYYEDGSLRDVLMNKVGFNDWKLYLEYVSKNYEISWYSTSGETKGINMQEVFEYLKSNADGYYMIKIVIGGFSIDCHIGGDAIENVLSPRDIKSIYDHNMLLNYMKSISKLLAKAVMLTSDNTLEDVLMSVSDDTVMFKELR